MPRYSESYNETINGTQFHIEVTAVGSRDKALADHRSMMKHIASLQGRDARISERDAMQLGKVEVTAD